MRTLPRYPGCPVCGDRAANPTTLGARWSWDEERGQAVGVFTPGPEHGGYEGRLHGGLLPALFDECLAWACAVRMGSYCVTGELTVRYKSPAPLGCPLTIRGATGEAWGRLVRASGEATLPGGELVAIASAVFSALSREESRRLHDLLVLAPGDWDFLQP